MKVKSSLLMLSVLSSLICDIHSFWFIDSDDDDYTSSGDLLVVDTNSSIAGNDTSKHKNEDIGGIDKVNITEEKGIVLNKNNDTDTTDTHINSVAKDITINKNDNTERIVKNDKDKKTDVRLNIKDNKDSINKNDYSNGNGKVIRRMPLKTDDKDIIICKEESIETREKKASVIITAKVLNLMLDPNDNDLRIAKIQIKRVFKGSEIIHAIADERPNAVSDDSYNKVISFHGIGERSICENSVEKGDTRIFMLNLEYFGNLRLSSSVIHISAYTLDRTDAAVNGKLEIYLRINEHPL